MTSTPKPPLGGPAHRSAEQRTAALVRAAYWLPALVALPFITVAGAACSQVQVLGALLNISVTVAAAACATIFAGGIVAAIDVDGSKTRQAVPLRNTRQQLELRAASAPTEVSAVSGRLRPRSDPRSAAKQCASVRGGR